MKIVTNKQMRLDELIKYVWENPAREKRVFHGNHDQRVVFDDVGNFYPSGYAFSDDSLFTVEVEEEVDEKTKLGEYGRLLIIHRDFNKKDLLYCDYTPTQDIGFTRKTHESNYKLEAVCLLTRKAEMITVWSAEHGIPTDGVLKI